MPARRGQFGVDRGMQLERGRDCAARVVAPGDRDAEQGHDLVADDWFTVPPWRSITAVASDLTRPMIASTSSGSVPRSGRCSRLRSETSPSPGGARRPRWGGPLGRRGRPGEAEGARCAVGAAARAEALAGENRRGALRTRNADRRAAGGAEPGADRNLGLAAGTGHRRPNSWEAASSPGGEADGKGCRPPCAAIQGRAARRRTQDRALRSRACPAYNRRLFCVLPFGSGAPAPARRQLRFGPGRCLLAPPSCV